MTTLNEKTRHQILSHLADGASREEIASRLHSTADIVDDRLADMRKVFGARNDEHLVALALKARLID